MAKPERTITDKILKSDFVNWRELEIIQPKGFKELSKPAYQKLRNSIIENNFVESFKVWSNGKTYLLDGVHRCKVLDILDGEGYDIPDKFRADFIECKDKKQAKKMILVYSSRYAKLLEEGLYEFVQDLDWEEITKVVDFADIDIDRFTDGYMRDTEGLTDDDEIPEVTEAITKTSDLWLLGDHRVLCGDATKKEDVERLMDGQKADLTLTDPPYGKGVTKMTLGTGKKNFHRGEWDNERVDILSVLGVCDLSIIWGGNYYTDVLPASNDWLCWHKKNDGLSFSEFELAWSNLGRNTRHFSHHWSGEEKKHPTQKPLPVFEWCLKLVNREKVFDPFLGSVTTLIACEKTNRKCYGLEIDEHYCDVIVKRWEDFTGNKAILDG